LINGTPEKVMGEKTYKKKFKKGTKDNENLVYEGPIRGEPQAG